MYCGSCLRDNALAAELLRRGHDVLLTPIYTPTRTDERNVSDRHVFFGGISVYLEQHAPLFRYTPRILDRLWDSTWALRLATKRQISVNPRSLGELTVSMLRGERGFQRKEIGKLLDWLRREPKFDVVNLPYALLIGLAEPLRRALKVPICCTLQGEDLFLDGLGEPYRSESLNLIREAAVHVDAFLAVSQYYADYMPKYLRIPPSRVRVAPLGINLEGYTPRRPARSGEPFTVGFFARVAPEKALHVLCDAYRRMRASGAAADARLVAAGYLAPEHRAYLDGISRQMELAGLAREFEYRGEVDRAGKIAFLQSLDVMSVPATYDEPKGMSEENFTRLFPALQGYRFFLIDDPAVHDQAAADRLTGTLEGELAPFGFDAVGAGERLDAFHRVENTYLSTFQMLGGLGLVLGTIGLSAIMVMPGESES